EEVANNPRRVDTVQRRVPDGAGGVVEVTQQMPVWVDPTADGATPMVGAFTQAEPVVAAWCAAHPTSFPPIVINVTDGASTDGDPSQIAARIRDLRTDDGAALVFNLHLSGLVGQPVVFPDSAVALPAHNAHTLFEMSSELPAAMLEAAASLGYPVQTGSRGFLYNAEPAVVIDFLDIGTRAVTPTGLKDLTGGDLPDADEDRPENA
ncbi:MAG: hypothetical protein J2O49_08910, partial [Sciscionella sp.]|nr:hypothetical protein [Sciscionella sp.]